MLNDCFDQSEVHKIRMGITDREYWRIECVRSLDALQSLFQENLGLDGWTVSEWRRLALSVQGVLRQVGLSSEEIEDSRRSIADQKYWKYEVEHWERIIKMCEFEMQEALLGQNEERH